MAAAGGRRPLGIDQSEGMLPQTPAAAPDGGNATPASAGGGR